MCARWTAGAVLLGLLVGSVLAGCSNPAHRTSSVLDAPRASVGVAPSEAARTRAITSSAPPSTEPPTRGDVERDLSLEIVRGEGPIETGHEADTQVLLVNRSTSHTYPVVLSSDGSDESGWREPHIWYTVERRSGSAAWEPAHYDARRICGNFDEDWRKDIVELGPGRRVPLPWFELRPGFWKLDDTKTIRVVAHYSYGEHVKDSNDIPPALRGMPAYTLASPPLELPLDEPIRLELRVLGPIPRRAKQPLAKVFEVVAVGQWKAPLPFSTPDAGGAHLSFKIEYEEKPGRVEEAYFSTLPGDSHAARDRIARGERRAVVGASTRTSEDWDFSPKTRLRRVRAVLSVYEEAGERSVFSPWVDLQGSL